MNDLEGVDVQNELLNSDDEALESKSVITFEDDESTNQIEEAFDASSENAEQTDEVAALKAEIESLRAQLNEREMLDKATARMNAELLEFEEYFPDVSLDQIPDAIWQKVKEGASLSAQYSLFRRKEELSKRKVSNINEKNRKMSSGSVAGGEGDKYYSPSEVKRMSPEQVRKHYDDIIESMRHWN